MVRTREEFRTLLGRAVYPDQEDTADDQRAQVDRVLAAWDAQAAELQRLRAEVERLRTGEPLTPSGHPDPGGLY